MGILPAYREAWLTVAMDYVEQGRLPVEMRPVIEAAAAGDRQLFGVVVSAVFRVDRFTREHLGRMIAELPPTRATAFHTRAQQAVEALAIPTDRRDASEPNGIVLSPSTVTSIFKRRLELFALKPLPSPDKVEQRLFRDIEYAREEIPELTEQARTGLADRIAHVLLGELRLERDALSIPPPPSQIAFAAIIADALQTPLTVIQAWQRWDGWPEVLSRLFVRLLADGRPEGGRTDSIASRTAGIAGRRAWYEDPLIQELEMSQLIRAHEALFKDSSQSSALKSLAELARFLPGSFAPHSGDRKAAALQAADLHQLHGMAPLLEGDQFLSLLTPYVRPLKPESMSAAFRDPEVPLTPFARYLSRMALTWHFGTPQQVADMLQRLISRNKRYGDLTEFASVMLGATPENLLRRLEQIAVQDAEVGPALHALMERFPQGGRRLLDTSPLLTEAALQYAGRQEAEAAEAEAQKGAEIGGFAELPAQPAPPHNDNASATQPGSPSTAVAPKPQQLAIPGLVAAVGTPKFRR